MKPDHLKKLSLPVISLFIGTSLLSIGLTSETMGSSASRQIRLGSVTLQIPERFLENGTGKAPGWFSWLPGLDSDDREALLVIPDEEVLKIIKGYQVSSLPLRLRVVEATAEELDRHRNEKDTVSAWEGHGLYVNRIIDLDNETNLYNVSSVAAHKKIWNAFRKNPQERSSQDKMLDVWVANCSRIGDSEPAYVVCRTFLFVENIIIFITVKGENLKKIDDIKAFVEKTVREWIVRI